MVARGWALGQWGESAGDWGRGEWTVEVSVEGERADDGLEAWGE